MLEICQNASFLSTPDKKTLKPQGFEVFSFFEIALKYLNLWVLLNILLNEKMFARSVILRRDLQ